ncbi:uncharacterized protein LOC112340860 isoform X1 [Selaginella moellendorffii]|uniref:uncharacterized protein LOC112340860 isoform X1 n=1 Tax=Selaginella moellendorffii TaxID=88036 RepID=UPI000D1C3E9C|nr:uncharacterized protein LOC112340860 isoform X1 [Selaginella moellendorffii]|eukprot:XP_024515771.1 uncharacterized protein LOC112340860 isoform X1 [Selaginella moellendorffii]
MEPTEAKYLFKFLLPRRNMSCRLSKPGSFRQLLFLEDQKPILVKLDCQCTAEDLHTGDDDCSARSTGPVVPKFSSFQPNCLYVCPVYRRSCFTLSNCSTPPGGLFIFNLTMLGT